MKIIFIYKRLVNHIGNIIKLMISLFISIFCKIHKGRILFWSTEGKDYACNPLYISNYILDHDLDSFEVYWMFRRSVNTENVDDRIKKVYFGTIKYLYIIETSEYIITNHRTYPKAMSWIKRGRQKYIMTWHGSMPLKMIGKDAEQSQSKGYIKTCRIDSRICNLMLSDSEWYTRLIRHAFAYEGPILEKGMPRNDILFDTVKHKTIKENVVSTLGLQCDKDTFIIMYAPTFRTNHKTDNYILKWQHIIDKVSKSLNKKVIILLRLHPTLLEEINTNDLITEDNVFNASKYYNMQELLVTSDMLITDYSSTMFEYSLLKKPCFLYTPDLISYDRGMYFPIKTLPFALSSNEEELIKNITSYCNDKYVLKATEFLNNTFHVFDNRNASGALVEWMKENSIN